MTVTTNTNKVQALGNGVTKTFPYAFRIYAATDLIVTVTDLATGVDTTQVLNTDYTVTGAGSYNGGNVVFVNAPAANTRVTIRRVLALTQGTDLRNQGSYFAETHEDVFDKLTMIDQQQQEVLERSFTFPATDDSTTHGDLPAAESRANNLLGFDENGRPVAVAPSAQSASALQALLAASSGSALIGFIRDAAGAVARTLQDLLRERVSVLDFMTPEQRADVRGGVGALDVTVAVQAAITYMAGRGGRLRFPYGTYKITAPLLVAGSNINLHLSAKANLVHTVYNENLFTVTGNNVSFTADQGGRLTSPATWDGTGVAQAPTYGVIHVTGRYFSAVGITLQNVPKRGIVLEAAADATISRCYLIGNYPTAQWTGQETVHFGIHVDPGGTENTNCTITDNHIYSCVQGVAVLDYAGSNTGLGIVVADNTFDGCLNHGCYIGAGTAQVVDGNTFVRCQIPIAIRGAYSVITGNELFTDATGTGGAASLEVTGMSVRDPVGCIIADNVIRGDAGASSVVIDLCNLTGGGTSVVNNIVADNTIYCGNSTGSASAIRLGTGLTVTNENNTIARNTIHCKGPSAGSGVGVVTVQMAAGSYGVLNRIIDNMIGLVSASYGIDINNQRHCLIERNAIRLEHDAAAPASIRAVQAYNCADTEYSRNRVLVESGYGQNINFGGISEDGACVRSIARSNTIKIDTTKAVQAFTLNLNAPQVVQDNVLSNDPMHGTATIVSGTSAIVVNNKNVSADNVMVWPLNSAAGSQVVATKGYYVICTPGVSFGIYTADGTTVTADARFGWKII